MEEYKYYEEIKNSLIKNEVYKKVKDYSKKKSDLETYYNVGKLLSEAGKHYGEGIIKKYSNKLTKELGKGYSVKTLYKMQQFYIMNENFSQVARNLSWSHYVEILSLKDTDEINYYINRCVSNNLSRNKLRQLIKSKEYQRLPESTKEKLKVNENLKLQELVPEPIIIKNPNNVEIIKEEILHNLILENITDFMEQLGEGYTFKKSEYKIKIGNRYNYIDLLLFNVEYNCYVVVELKITELKKEHIGQIEVYMNYIDQNIKKLHHDKTIGIIICKKNNEYIIEYASDERILSREYIIVP